MADLQGRYTWREMQRIASIAIDRDGEVFFRATAQTTGGFTTPVPPLPQTHASN